MSDRRSEHRDDAAAVRAAKRRDILARVLESAGAEFDDARFRRAAGVLRGEPSGRRGYDDDRHLAEMADLIRRGQAKSAHRAAELVAEAIAPAGEVEATRDRLRKKYRTFDQKSEN